MTSRLRGRGQSFCDDSGYALLLKSVMMGGGAKFCHLRTNPLFFNVFQLFAVDEWVSSFLHRKRSQTSFKVELICEKLGKKFIMTLKYKLSEYIYKIRARPPGMALTPLRLGDSNSWSLHGEPWRLFICGAKRHLYDIFEFIFIKKSWNNCSKALLKFYVKNEMPVVTSSRFCEIATES